ncbi:MAG: hypothetical protein PXY39_10115 [archaeon]|nr:hypothetical protein [archaeon]
MSQKQDRVNNVPETKGNPDYLVSEQFKVLEGYDICRSNRLIVALVVVDGNFGQDLRMYRWQLRNDAWKVNLSRKSVADWKWEEISKKARDLIQKYEIKLKGNRSESTA